MVLELPGRTQPCDTRTEQCHCWQQPWADRPWEQPLLTLQRWLCPASATSWGQPDGTTVTLPSVMQCFKGNMDLIQPRGHAHEEQAHTYTLLSHGILQGNVGKAECNCSVCSYHVCQSRHYQLSRRSLRVASCQTSCFLSHLTRDSYSSKEPQAPCGDTTVLGL